MRKKGGRRGREGGEVIGQEKICYTKPATVALLRVESAVNQREKNNATLFPDLLEGTEPLS